MSQNIKQVAERIDTLAKHINFNDDMFVYLCKNIIAECKKFGDDGTLTNRIKELIHERSSCPGRLPGGGAGRECSEEPIEYGGTSQTIEDQDG
jgi:hypothetical protein